MKRALSPFFLCLCASFSLCRTMLALPIDHVLQLKATSLLDSFNSDVHGQSRLEGLCFRGFWSCSSPVVPTPQSPGSEHCFLGRAVSSQATPETPKTSACWPWLPPGCQPRPVQKLGLQSQLCQARIDSEALNEATIVPSHILAPNFSALLWRCSSSCISSAGIAFSSWLQTNPPTQYSAEGMDCRFVREDHRAVGSRHTANPHLCPYVMAAGLAAGFFRRCCYILQASS